MAALNGELFILKSDFWTEFPVILSLENQLFCELPYPREKESETI